MIDKVTIVKVYNNYLKEISEGEGERIPVNFKKLIEFIDSLRYSMDPELRECFEKTYLFPSGETGGYCLYDASQRRKACLAFYDSMISSLKQNT